MNNSRRLLRTLDLTFEQNQPSPHLRLGGESLRRGKQHVAGVFELILTSEDFCVEQHLARFAELAGLLETCDQGIDLCPIALGGIEPELLQGADVDQLTPNFGEVDDRIAELGCDFFEQL